MRVCIVEQDVATVTEWYGHYEKGHYTKVPLYLATLTEGGAETYRKNMEADGWEEVCWYPSCHDYLETAYKVFLFAKKNKVEPVKDFKVRIYENYYGPGQHMEYRFNSCLGLSCSCQSLPRRVKNVRGGLDTHGIISLHRSPKITKFKTINGWRKFATTSQAEYWFWGLVGDEDRHKFEKDNKRGF